MSSLGWIGLRSGAMILDVHTHNPDARDAIINVEPGFAAYRPEAFYSIGIHPWHTSLATSQLISQLEEEATNSQIIAIGETGLDRLKGGPLERQMELFETHVAISERLEKPLIIHCVRAWAELLGVRKRLRPKQPWIIHGFIGNSRLLRKLIDAGVFFSFPWPIQASREQTYDMVPKDRLLYETDDAPLSIVAHPSATAAEVARRLFHLPEQQISHIRDEESKPGVR